MRRKIRYDELIEMEFWKSVRQKEREAKQRRQNLIKNSFWVGVGQIQVRLAAFV